MSGRVLAVDDEPDILETWRDLLEPEGFEVAGVRTVEAAVSMLETGGEWDVLLVDEKLQGPGGADYAHEVLARAASIQPNARCILVTGYATAARAKVALAAGAWDYLQKDAVFLPILLPVRVSHAAEAARDLRLRRPRADLEAQLRARCAELDDPALPAQRRGHLLEEVVALLVQTIDGLSKVRTNVSNESEEIDVVVENRSADGILSKEGSFLLVECKNWSSRVGPAELAAFRDKLRDRYGRARLGILVGLGGFTGNVEKKIERESNRPELVLLVDRAALDGWIRSSDRARWLTDRIAAASFRQS